MDGASLLSTTIALVVVCALAIGVLRALGGRAARAGGGMRVLGRLPVETRRSVVVVEVAGRCFLVGVGDGPMALIAELDAADARARLLARERAPVGGVMRAALKRVLGGADEAR
jgi:flagellar biosynthetic protein FliO